MPIIAYKKYLFNGGLGSFLNIKNNPGGVAFLIFFYGTVYLGIHNKIEAFTEILQKLNLRDEEVCVVGDDLPDMPIMRRCGYPVAVANARPELKEIAAYVTDARGGDGAVREVIEKVLKAQGKWDGVMARYRE